MWKCPWQKFDERVFNKAITCGRLSGIKQRLDEHNTVATDVMILPAHECQMEKKRSVYQNLKAPEIFGGMNWTWTVQDDSLQHKKPLQEMGVRRSLVFMNWARLKRELDVVQESRKMGVKFRDTGGPCAGSCRW